MAFCTNCGKELLPNAKYCTECGNVVNTQQNQRETVYEGKIYKCPSCGEILNSFISCCPSCGYEVRGASAASSVVRFYDDLSKTTSYEQKDYMIRNFPVPNTKEDLIEFMVLASSNIFGEDNKDIFEAWMAKFEQCYQKALIVLNNDNDLYRVQQIYDDCQNKIELEKGKKITKLTFETMARNIAVVAGLILLLIAIRVDKNGGNSSMFELVACIVLIVSSTSLIKRNAILLDYGVAAVSGLLAIAASFLLKNGSLVQLSGGVVLIIVAVNYFKSIVNRKK